MRPKPPVPKWRWALWWSILGAAVFTFYVLLTPIWLGLRALAWAAEQLAGYKRPRWVHVVDELPLTAVAKIDKQALSARAAAGPAPGTTSR